MRSATLDLPAGWSAYDLSDPATIPPSLSPLLEGAHDAGGRMRWLLVRDPVDPVDPDGGAEVVAVVAEAPLSPSDPPSHQQTPARVIAGGWDPVSPPGRPGVRRFRRRLSCDDGTPLVQDLAVVTGGESVHLVQVHRRVDPTRPDTTPLVEQLMAGITPPTDPAGTAWRPTNVEPACTPDPTR